jgi:hypothetical protein
MFDGPPFDELHPNALPREAVDSFAASKHGGEIWWLRTLLDADALASVGWLRTRDWRIADIIVLPLPLGLCYKPLKVQPRFVAVLHCNPAKALAAIRQHPSFPSASSKYLLVGTAWWLRGKRLDLGGFILGGKLPGDPSLGQRREVIVPMASSILLASSSNPFAASSDTRPLISAFVGQMTATKRVYEDRRRMMRAVCLPPSRKASGRHFVASLSPLRATPTCAEDCAANLSCCNCSIDRMPPSEFARLCQSAVFGWHAGGDTNSSNRLYDVLMAGSIPIVLGRKLTASMPFLDGPERVPWEKLVVFVEPEDLESGAAMQNIMSLVEQQPRTVLEKMRIHLNAHVSKVLWNWKPQHVAKQVLERAYVTTQE